MTATAAGRKLDIAPDGATEHIPIVIVGAGFAGVALGAQLRRAGIAEFAVLERGESVGGVWRDNTYPGCACDVPSALYSLSFAPNPDWTRLYASQSEILSYIEWVSEEYGVARHIRMRTELLDARWDEGQRLWQLQTSAGLLTAGVLVSSMGPFGKPVIPQIAGRESFAGATFHSARWNHDCDLKNKRVAVIGTGASAVQFVPAIAPDVAELVLFQRTPPWVMPRLDGPIGIGRRTVFRALPLTQRVMRAGFFAYLESLALVNFVSPIFRHLPETIARAKLRRQVRDSRLRAQLTPGYMFGCKRAVTSDDYLPALARDNVHVVTTQISQITPEGVVTRDGVHHDVDVIIWGTGFEAPSRHPVIIHGRDGNSLIDRYDERPQSYLGVALTGFPNLFWTLGPYGTSGNQSALYMIECQVQYIVEAIRTMRRENIATIEVREDKQEEFVSEAERRSAETVWVNGGCRSYYQTADGRNAGLWPNWTRNFAKRTRTFEPDDYILTRSAVGAKS